MERRIWTGLKHWLEGGRSTPQPKPVRAGAVGVSVTMEPFPQSSRERGCAAHQCWRRHACPTTPRRVASSVTSMVVTAGVARRRTHVHHRLEVRAQVGHQCLAPGSRSARTARR